MTKLSEQEMATLVINWLELQHWDVYQEVQFNTNSSIADIVAVRNGLIWVIECKKALTFAVMDQAKNWRSHLRSIAVPKIRDWRSRNLPYDICKNYLSVGVLLVTNFGTIREEVSPPIMRSYHKVAKSMILQLSEAHKNHAQAGSANGGHYTPYRATMDLVKLFISDNPGCTLNQIFAEIEEHHHYASNQSAKQSIRKALENWEDWCRVDRSQKEYRYFINDQH